MNLYSYKYKDNIYDFRMSYGAKLEIEKIQNMNYGVFEDKEFAKAFAKIKKSKSEDMNDLPEEVLAEVLPEMGKIATLGNELDSVRVGYILLKNNPKYVSLTEQEFFEIENDMEEKLGFEKTMEIFNEMYTKVFHLLERLQESHKKKESKAEKKPS